MCPDPLWEAKEPRGYSWQVFHHPMGGTEELRAGLPLQGQGAGGDEEMNVPRVAQRLERLSSDLVLLKLPCQRPMSGVISIKTQAGTESIRFLLVYSTSAIWNSVTCRTGLGGFIQ